MLLRCCAVGRLRYAAARVAALESRDIIASQVRWKVMSLPDQSEASHCFFYFAIQAFSLSQIQER